MNLPKHVSHSQLSSWTERCQKAFFLERIAGASPTPAWWLIGGSTVHEVTEDLDRRGLEFNLTSAELNVKMDIEELFWSKLDQLIQEAEQKTETPKEDWIAAGYRPKQDESYWRQNGPQMVSNWLTWRDLTGWKIAEMSKTRLGVTWYEPGIELKLDIELSLSNEQGGPSFFSSILTSAVGAPDRVMILPNGELVIVDVKSGSTTPATLLQQGLYACMIERTYGLRPKYGTFVKVGVKAGGVHTPLTPLKKYDERYFEHLFSAYRAQAETGTFLPTVGDFCDRCGVQQYCYASGGAQSADWDPLDPNYQGVK